MTVKVDGQNLIILHMRQILANAMGFSLYRKKLTATEWLQVQIFSVCVAVSGEASTTSRYVIA